MAHDRAGEVDFEEQRRSRKARIDRLRGRLSRSAAPEVLAVVLKGVLDLLEDEL